MRPLAADQLQGDGLLLDQMVRPLLGRREYRLAVIFL
jgi:hypothetical protein